MNLKFERGFPTEETTQKLFDEMDYQRAVQAYLWAYPAVSFESIRLGDEAGPGHGLQRSGHRRQFADPKGLWLTANDTTIYGVVNIDLGKTGRSSLKFRPGRSSD